MSKPKSTVPKISVSALGTPDKDGFLTKQGGSIKTWKRRWFVLKGDTVYYYKNQKDPGQAGEIKLEATTVCQSEPGMNKKKRYYFSIGTPNRVFLIYSDSEENTQQWVKKLSAAIDNVANPKKDEPADPAPGTNGVLLLPLLLSKINLLLLWPRILNQRRKKLINLLLILTNPTTKK